jgi:tetratricopeptide (TPR) repeat protein
MDFFDESQTDPTVIAAVIFIAGAGLMLLGQRAWLARVEGHPFLSSEEKLQNKDALVIATFFTVTLHLGLCIAGSAAAHLFPRHVSAAAQLTLVWALACCSVGAAFGFLLGHPRRTAEDKVGKEDRTTTSWLLRTGLDDIVDWLVKGITTVLLVESKQVLQQLDPLAKLLGGGLEGGLTMAGLYGDQSHVPAEAVAFSQGVIVFFTLFGALAACLVTRTYLTGALGRADRSTAGALTHAGLSFSEGLLLLRHQSSLGSRGHTPLSPEVESPARKLAGLSLEDLRTPQEFALWAKAKSALGEPEVALRGYVRAIVLCECDPALLLDYAVALHASGDLGAARNQLEEAHLHLSAATAPETAKNIFKSLTFSVLYLDPPQSFERALMLIEEYDRSLAAGNCTPSSAIRVNEACAWGQRFLWKAQSLELLKEEPNGPLRVTLAEARETWPQELIEAFDKALAAIKSALAMDRTWITRFQILLQRHHPAKKPGTEEAGLTDLEVFEGFKEFREILSLPPLASKAETGDAPHTDKPEDIPSSDDRPSDEKKQPETDPAKTVETEKAPPPVKREIAEPGQGTTSAETEETK